METEQDGSYALHILDPKATKSIEEVTISFEKTTGSVKHRATTIMAPSLVWIWITLHSWVLMRF